METLESKGRRIGLPLPPHIVQVIFSKLSISNLPTCRLVCKTWNDLILDSKFLPNSSSFLLCTSDVLPNLPDCNPKMRCIDLQTMDYVSSFRFEGDWSTISIFNYCNGLLFISKDGDDHISDGVLNPMTNEFFKLPGPELEPIYHFGFGFRSQMKGYKLFNVTSLREECTSIMNVFTFGRTETNPNHNCWRHLHSLSFGICDHGLYFNGVIYWIGRERDKANQYVIHVLDVETEQIESIAVLEVGPFSKRAILQPFNSTIYATIFTPDKIQVWKMLEIHSWVKVFVIDHHIPPHQCPCEHQFLFCRLVKVSEDGEISFLIGDDLFYLDRTGKKINIKKFNPNEVLVTGGCHIESLNFGSLTNILVGEE